MSKADELIAGLQTEAEFDSAGAFSLDREKARQKMRQFQLADPHRYVLLLVEAAVLRGATQIAFEIDTDDMHMRFDAALDWEDLDELYSALFVDRSSVGIRARRELALACNAAMALNPRWIRIESWKPDSGVRALLRPDAHDEIERIAAPPAAEAPATHIHVKDRFRPGLLVRFLHNLGDALPEAELLRQRCSMASIPITLDGKQISFGLPRRVIAAVEFEAEGLCGVAGLHPNDTERSSVVLLSNGVAIVNFEISDSVPGLWFWVDSSRFRKDVSQADIVRGDPSYEAMLAAVANARTQVLGKLAQAWQAGEFEQHPQWTSDKVLTLLRDCFIRWADADWLSPDAGPLGSIADLPLWRTLEGGWLSPRQLAAEADPERGIMYSTHDFDGVQPLGWGPIIHTLDPQRESEAIPRVYGDAAHDVTDELERKVPWELNRRRWRKRKHPPTLPRGAEQPIDIRVDEIVGQVVARPAQQSHVRIVVDGCLLCEIEFDLGVLGISAVLAGPFEPTRDYAQVRPDRSLASAAFALLAQLPHLLLHTPGLAVGQLRRSMLLLAQPELPKQWLVAFGFDPSAAEAMLARVPAPVCLPELGVGREPTPLARMLSFTTADQRTVSLAEIDAERQRRAEQPGKVLIVDEKAPLTRGLEQLILRVDRQERELLTAIFGRERIHDHNKSYRREIGRHRFFAKPPTRPFVPGATWTTKVEYEGITGLVGINAFELRNWKGHEQRAAKIEVIVQARQLTVLEPRAWVPGSSASLVWDQAPVNADWDGIEGSTRPLQLAAEAGVLAIVETHAREAIEQRRRPDPEVRRLLWMVMSAPMLSSEHARAWWKLRTKLDFEAAVEAYFDLLALYPAVALNDLREGITLLLDDDRLPTRSAVLELLMRADPGARGGHGFQREVLERYRLLEEVPLVELCSGATLNLTQLVENFEANGEVAYVQDTSLHFDSDKYVIVRPDTIDQVALVRLFGKDALKEVSAWVHERRHQARFETQEPLPAIRVHDQHRMLGVEFEREGTTGELAIPPWPPGELGLMKLTFCHQRRVVEELVIHAKQPVIGIIDDPEAPLSKDFQKIDQKSARMATIRKLLDAVFDEQLLPALADAYPTLEPDQQSIARAWIFDHWRRCGRRVGQYPNRLSAAGRSFAELELFVDVDQTPCSLADLSARYRKHKQIWFVEQPPQHSVPPPFPILWCRGDDERELIEELFENLEDASARWQLRVEGEHRRQQAPELRMLSAAPDRSTGAVVSNKVERHGLVGYLWLPDRLPFEGGVLLGSGGKLLTMHSPSDLLLVQGVVDGVRADDSFTHAELSLAQQRYLEARVITLYRALLEQHQRDVEHPERPDFHDPTLVAERGHRLELLRRAAIQLARARVLGFGMDAILTRFEKRLEQEPLLRLASGRLISVDVARRARPQELAHLGLWDPSDPGLDPADLDPDERALLLGEEQESAPDSEAAGEQSETEAQPGAGEAETEITSVVPPEGPISVELLDADHRVVPMSEDELAGALLERVREELRLLREREEIALTEGQLDAIRAERHRGRELVRIDEWGVVFDFEHPRFARAMHDPDPIWVSFLASVAYTGLNRWLDEITDRDELNFHQRHAEHLLSGLLDEQPPS